jgi:putative nucleotidyltransferase with HDIG domain
MRNPNASANELRRVIEVDPPLSARILRRANSASSGLKRSICSIQEAIVLLGFNTVRELAFSLKVAKIFSGGEGRRAELRKRLWKHSLAVALCAKQLYRLEFKERGEGIYSAGLLHDIGIIAEDQFAWSFLEEALVVADERRISLREAEIEVFNFDHAQLGGELTGAWRMPNELVKTIAYHHSPLAVDPLWQRQAASIGVCDYVCKRISLGVEASPGEEDGELHMKTLQLLGVVPESLDMIAEDVAKDLQALEAKGELYL